MTEKIGVRKFVPESLLDKGGEYEQGLTNTEYALGVLLNMGVTSGELTEGVRFRDGNMFLPINQSECLVFMPEETIVMFWRKRDDTLYSLDQLSSLANKFVRKPNRVERKARLDRTLEMLPLYNLWSVQSALVLFSASKPRYSRRTYMTSGPKAVSY